MVHIRLFLSKFFFLFEMERIQSEWLWERRARGAAKIYILRLCKPFRSVRPGCHRGEQPFQAFGSWNLRPTARAGDHDPSIAVLIPGKEKHIYSGTEANANRGPWGPKLRPTVQSSKQTPGLIHFQSKDRIQDPTLGTNFEDLVESQPYLCPDQLSISSRAYLRPEPSDSQDKSYEDSAMYTPYLIRFCESALAHRKGARSGGGSGGKPSSRLAYCAPALSLVRWFVYVHSIVHSIYYLQSAGLLGGVGKEAS